MIDSARSDETSSSALADGSLTTSQIAPTSGELTYSIRTYGCKVNTYDTGLLQKRLSAAGYLTCEDESRPRVHILNTCAVTAEATKESLREIRRIKAKDPLATVVVTGCAAQVDTGAYENLPGADLVIANSHKGQLEDLIKKYLRGELEQKVFKSNIFKKDDLEAGGGIEAAHTRAFVKIQDGCNSFCTFCIIPFARGKSRSLSVQELVRRVNQLYSQGVREVVLTGVHIGDYADESVSADQKVGLEALVEALLLQTSMPRFRLSSLEPIELSDKILDLYSDSRMCPHFHMSIQSAQTRVLSAMKRQYDAAAVEKALISIDKRVPGAFVGMDVIAGFPSETPEEFSETEERLRSLPWQRIHVFPYSPRPGVYANRLQPQWDRSEIVRRAARLRTLSAERFHSEALEQVGSTKNVMVLRGKRGKSSSLSHDYWKVQLPEGDDLQAGTLRDVKITGYQPAGAEGWLIGEWL